MRIGSPLPWAALVVACVVLAAPSTHAQRGMPIAPPAEPSPPSAPPAPAKKRTIAVLPLRADALQLNEAQRLNFLIRQRAATRGGFDVQSEETTTQLVEASQNLGLDCDVNAAECGTQLGKIADVELVMLGRATGGLVDTSKPGGPAKVGVDLRLIDVQQGTELRHVSALLPADAVQQTDAVNALSELFYGTDPLVAVEVIAAPPGADVRVDGVLRGSAPLAGPVDALAPGPHHVQVAKKGFIPFNAIIDINKGEAARLEVTLEVDPEAVHSGPTTFDIALPFVIGGVGAAVAIGGGVMTFVGLQPWFAYDEGKRTIDSANPDDRDYVATVTVANKQAREGAEAWTSWGQGVTVAGITLASVGTAAAGVGIGWGIYQLTRSDEAPDLPSDRAGVPAAE